MKMINSKVVYGLLGIIMVGMIATVSIGGICLSNMQKSLTILNDQFGEKSETTQENDVVIAGEYTIKETTPISDAYKSGDTKDLDDKQKETLKMASDVLKEVIKDDMTDFEKEKAVYDWMCANLSQDQGLLTVIPHTQADCDNPYGVLKYHNAVCVGYATTFRLFMQMMDITCMVCHNSEEYHSWDLVKLDDQWYHTDIYSDVESGSYANFNLNDAMMGQNQNWDTSFFPAAEGLKYNMAYQNSTECKDIYEIPAIAIKAVMDKQKMIGLKFGKDFTEEQAAIAMNMINSMSSAFWETEKYSDVSLSGSFTPTDEGYLLMIRIYDYSSNEEENFTDEEIQKMQDAIDQAFEKFLKTDVDVTVDDNLEETEYSEDAA